MHILQAKKKQPQKRKQLLKGMGLVFVLFVICLTVFDGAPYGGTSTPTMGVTGMTENHTNGSEPEATPFETPSPSSEPTDGPAEAEEKTLFTVTRIVDGDTIEIDYYGAKEKIRLIGVDTPESVHPDGEKNSELGIIAGEFTKSALLNQEIELEFDVAERDGYGRILAYVWLDGVMYNEYLVEQGYAQVATYPPNVKYVDKFTAAQEQARESKAGLWQYADSPASVVIALETQAAITPTPATKPAPTSTPDPAAAMPEPGPAPAPEPEPETIQQVVWIPNTGKKYHSYAGCSNMKNPSSVPLETAISRGFTQCSKCW